MREAFEDAQTGAEFLPCVDLAAEVDAARQVINAASAVQALRVAQYAAREQEQDSCGVWGEANPASCAAVEALIYPAVLAEAPGAVTRRVRRSWDGSTPTP